jgi:hypothetical protein
MRTLDFFKRLFKRKEKTIIKNPYRENIPIPSSHPIPHHHMSESKLYKQPNHYSKRMWNNKKSLPKNFKDEDEND